MRIFKSGSVLFGVYIFGSALVCGCAAQNVVAPTGGEAQAQARFVVSEALADDVRSVDQIVLAVYDVISGPAGERRDWDRFRHLFHAEGRLIARTGTGTGTGAVILSVEDYISRTDQAFFENGFYEAEIAKRVERFGNIAHVFSTYTSRRTVEDAEPFARGINSIQLVFEDGRWWVLNLLWQGETEGIKLPERYLEP